MPSLILIWWLIWNPYGRFGVPLATTLSCQRCENDVPESCLRLVVSSWRCFVVVCVASDEDPAICWVEKYPFQEIDFVVDSSSCAALVIEQGGRVVPVVITGLFMLVQRQTSFSYFKGPFPNKRNNEGILSATDTASADDAIGFSVTGLAMLSFIVPLFNERLVSSRAAFLAFIRKANTIPKSYTLLPSWSGTRTVCKRSILNKSKPVEQVAYLSNCFSQQCRLYHCR